MFTCVIGQNHLEYNKATKTRCKARMKGTKASAGSTAKIRQTDTVFAELYTVQNAAHVSNI